MTSYNFFVFFVFVFSLITTLSKNMAAGVMGMAFIPYYNQLMEILSTNPDLRKSAKGVYPHRSVFNLQVYSIQ